MTKLAEWLSGLVAVFSVWYAVNAGLVAEDWARENPALALWWPVVAVAAFGVYCVSVIAYRVATFNNCDEAAEELQREIKEAREDLKSKGIKL